MFEKYTTKSRTFKFSPDRRFISVYINGQLSGFIFNTNKIIKIDGDDVLSSEFFK